MCTAENRGFYVSVGFLLPSVYAAPKQMISVAVRCQWSKQVSLVTSLPEAWNLKPPPRSSRKILMYPLACTSGYERVLLSLVIWLQTSTIYAHFFLLWPLQNFRLIFHLLETRSTALSADKSLCIKFICITSAFCLCCTAIIILKQPAHGSL